jgi:hypothetical protein
MLKQLGRYVYIAKNPSEKIKKKVQNVDVGNFSCPKIIKIVNPLKSSLL